jgi:extracellular factor (EF) 3-hydroxypalmitic acid methyl ester biosynthesis protein
MENQELKESLVVFSTSQGMELRATLKRVSLHQVVLEVYNPAVVLQMSEVLSNFKIIINERTCYEGKGVVRNLIVAGSTVVCDVTLHDSAWKHSCLDDIAGRNGALARQFKGFVEEWQKLYRVTPEYKLIIGDMHTFLTDFRLWAEQIDTDLAASIPGGANRSVNEVAEEIAEVLIPPVNALFEKFETIAKHLDVNFSAMHGNYMRRHLHPLVLCSPFAWRTYEKPLGYAGDYEMVNMIARDGYEGESLFAKVINRWFLKQTPALGHRNRLAYLSQKLVDETLRVSHGGRRMTVFNLACGPACEIQEFLTRQEISSAVDFMLLDFNEATLLYARNVLEATQRRHNRASQFQFTKKSVHQLLKESGKIYSSADYCKYDFVYCAGLFDYLSDQVCHRLLNSMYDWLSPGGLLVATNVEPSNPLRHGMEHLLDWHLNYRRAGEFMKIAPTGAPLDSVRVIADDTGVNLFMEVRKPLHA